MRQPTKEEQAVIVAAWNARETVRNNERNSGSNIERFVAGTSVWGNETDHFSRLFGIPVLHDPTLPKGVLLYAIGRVVE